MPESLEIERRYLLAHAPDLGLLSSLSQVSEIQQIYLRSTDPESEIRIRQRTQEGDSRYFRTEKRRLSEITREETESEIARDDYCRLLEQADPNRRPIIKTRHVFPHRDLLFELDQFHSPAGLWILEVELDEETDQVILPSFILIEREVTGESQYTNAELARR